MKIHILTLHDHSASKAFAISLLISQTDAFLLALSHFCAICYIHS